MNKMKFFVSALALVSMVFTSCKKDGSNPPVITPNDSTEVVLEDIPLLDTPEAGFVTIAVRAPEGTCNGMVAVGTVNGWGMNEDCAFTKVEGTETWYQVTLTYAADMQVKVVARPEQGELNWNYQWGMNKEGEDPNVILLGEPGCVIDNSENGGEVKLVTFVDASLTYIDVKAWKSEPCTPKNEAGTATWVVKVPATTPETAKVSVVGGWGADGDPEYWALGAVVMERQADGTYTLTKEVPAAFQYKYVVSADGATWSWDYQYDKQFDMPVSLKAEDEIPAWSKEPWASEETPAN